MFTEPLNVIFRNNLNWLKITIIKYFKANNNLHLLFTINKEPLFSVQNTVLITKWDPIIQNVDFTSACIIFYIHLHLFW